MTITFPDITDTIFFEPGKTDDLLEEMRKKRDALAKLHADSAKHGADLSGVVADLQLMEEKTVFFAEMAEKTQGLFVPPPQGDTEKAMHTLEAHVFKHARNTSMVLGLLSLPLMLDLIVKGGRVMKITSDTGRVARMAKSTRYTKMMKFAKGSLYLAAAVELASFVVNMIASKKLNEELRSELANLKGKVAKGQKDYQHLLSVLADAKAERAEMLASVGAATPEDYVRAVNESLADMGRQKANFDTVRRMLQHGLDEQMILSMVQGVDAEAITLLRQRLDAELKLAAGESPTAVGEALGLDADQVAAIGMVIDTRDALVRGFSEEEVAEMIGVGPGQLDDADDMLDENLPKHWQEIDGDAALAPIAAKLILRTQALSDLRTELQAKAQIHAGQDIGQISGAVGAAREAVVKWASDLPLAQEGVRLMREEGTQDPSMLAAAHRLPFNMVVS